jgi:hypothetical protein
VHNPHAYIARSCRRAATLPEPGVAADREDAPMRGAGDGPTRPLNLASPGVGESEEIERHRPDRRSIDTSRPRAGEFGGDRVMTAHLPPRATQPFLAVGVV